MKNVIYILLFSCNLLWGQHFEKGNEEYRKGNYEAAVAQYEAIVKSKKESADLYFNLGNAYYKLNRVAPAIYNYEKALLLRPNDADIENNLKFAQKLQVDDVQAVPKAGLSKSVSLFTSLFGYNTWAWISVGFAFLVLICFAGYYLSVMTLAKRILFIAMFVMVFALVISILSAWHQKSSAEQEQPAIVFATVAHLKSEPTPDATDAYILHEGSKVNIIERLDDWNRVMLPDGNEGWIRSSAIKALK